MDLVETGGLGDYPALAAMGPEPLGPAFDGAYLAQALAGRRQGVKTLLLDQRVVAGLGNIYACEALHRARISPLAPAGAVAERRLARLAGAVRAVLGEAIAAGGRASPARRPPARAALSASSRADARPSTAGAASDESMLRAREDVRFM
jgi:formamidopyrimidine-DNA glycosylase